MAQLALKPYKWPDPNNQLNQIEQPEVRVEQKSPQTTIATWKLAAKKTCTPFSENFKGSPVGKVKVKKLQKRIGVRVMTTKGKLRAAGISDTQVKTIPAKASRGHML